MLGEPVKNKYKPSPGWKRIAGAVYERTDGLRLHTLGRICRLTNGQLISDEKSPEYYSQGRYIAINGGNQKRGLMAWARSKQLEIG